MREKTPWAGFDKGWGVDIQVGDIVELAAYEPKSPRSPLFRVIEKREGGKWGDYASIVVENVRFTRGKHNRMTHKVYNARKVDAVTALAALGRKT